MITKKAGYLMKVKFYDTADDALLKFAVIISKCGNKLVFCKHKERITARQFSRRLPNTIQKVALRKLMMIDNAKCLEDLKVPPNNHLEQLSGDRKGQHSIRINDQWRVCFTEKDGHYYDVEIVDYH